MNSTPEVNLQKRQVFFLKNNSPNATKIAVAEIMNEFVCHLPWHILQTAAFYNFASEKIENIKGWDAMLLAGIDAIINDPNSRKYMRILELLYIF